MYKIIACDLDETLLTSLSQVSPLDQEYIRKITDLGVKFVCASGRGFLSFQNTLKETGTFDLENEYTISFNGCAITENKNNRIISFDGITYDQANTLFLEGLKYDVCIHVYTIDNCYIYDLWEDEKRYLGHKMSYVEIFNTDLSFLKDKQFTKVVYVNTNREYLKSIENDLKGICQDFDISYSSNRYLEFNHKGVNKGNGLIKLCNYLNVDIKDTIAIGDNYNDLSMIQNAGLGIGVKNTPIEMQPLCDYITEATNNENAITEVIKKFILNE